MGTSGGVSVFFVVILFAALVAQLFKRGETAGRNREPHRRCSACKVDVPPRARFCPQCGLVFVEDVSLTEQPTEPAERPSAGAVVKATTRTTDIPRGERVGVGFAVACLLGVASMGIGALLCLTVIGAPIGTRHAESGP